MIDFPAVTGRQIIRALHKLGFKTIRTKGSHYFLRHSDGRSTAVPVHSGDTIGRGLLAQIIKNCEITREQLKEHL